MLAGTNTARRVLKQKSITGAHMNWEKNMKLLRVLGARENWLHFELISYCWSSCPWKSFKYWPIVGAKGPKVFYVYSILKLSIKLWRCDNWIFVGFWKILLVSLTVSRAWLSRILFLESNEELDDSRLRQEFLICMTLLFFLNGFRTTLGLDRKIIMWENIVLVSIQRELTRSMQWLSAMVTCLDKCYAIQRCVLGISGRRHRKLRTRCGKQWWWKCVGWRVYSHASLIKWSTQLYGK